MKVVTLGLGANRSFNACPPVETLVNAVRALDTVLSDMRISSVYRTGALYVTDQADFYNMIVRGAYEGTPRALLSCIHDIENRYGRDRSQEVRNGPPTHTNQLNEHFLPLQCAKGKSEILGRRR